ncbi:hypothetical protein J2Y73_002417 [Peribacillus frigoritolerans]|nr:hypothetical protein [Peribacillus frigoritolerans]
MILRLFLYWHDFFQKDRSAQFVEVRKTFHLQLIRYGFYLYVITKLIGEKGASPPLDKRVPAAVMYVQIVQSIKKLQATSISSNLSTASADLTSIYTQQ